MRRGTDRAVMARVGRHVRSHVVGYVALVIAVTMTPLPTHASHLVVRTSDIVNGAVTTSRIRDGAVTARKIRDGSVGSSKLRSDLRPRWAIVSASGQLIRGRRVVEVRRTSTGSYRLTFDRDVSKCAYLPSQAGARIDDGGVMSPSAASGGGADVTVLTRTPTDSLPGPMSFQIQVVC